MVRRSNWIFLVAWCFLSTFCACKNENKLERIIRKELASGVRNDSLFLGVYMGMDLQEFYDHCWKLNKQEIVKEGGKNMSVEYIFKDSLDNPIAFNFYPHLQESKIIHIYNTSFYYYGWAPWNKHLQSDKLFEMIQPILMEWHGGNEPFTQIKDGKKHLYKIDGNRMIDLFIYDEKTLVATYSDLSYNNNPEVGQ